MDVFDLLASTPPRKKKQKIGEHGVSPQQTPDVKKCEEAHLTDVKNDDVVEKEHGPVLQTGQRKQIRRRTDNLLAMPPTMSLKNRLKNWGLDKEFTVSEGTRVGCIACMKYGAWYRQEGADMKKKKKKNAKNKEKKKRKLLRIREVHTEEVKSPGKSSGPAEADSDDEEAMYVDLHNSLEEGTYQPPVTERQCIGGHRLKYSLNRHLSGLRHKKAAGARDEEFAIDRDVPSDAQMMFAYDEVKKDPMVSPPCCMVDTIYTMGL